MRIRRGGRGCRSSPRSGSAGGAAVDVGPAQLGVAARAVVLAGNLLNSFVRNSESLRERLFSRSTNKNANKSNGCG